ncbi:MAG: DKNYY domain-containing protein [Bacteroidota bacterium]
MNRLTRYWHKPGIWVFVLGMLTSACTPHYEQQEDGQWAWVSYDEAVGKRVTPVPADPESFEILSPETFGRDAAHVFYKSGIIEGADPESFTILPKGYARDKDQVFIHTIPIVDVDPETFEILKYPYSRDKNHIFCGTLPLLADVNAPVNVLKGGNGYSIALTAYFIRDHPEYAFVDTALYPAVLRSDGRIRIGKEVFDGFTPVP